jgi:hypothetical protein
MTWKYYILKSNEEMNGKVQGLQRQDIKKEELEGAPDGVGWHNSKGFDWKLIRYTFEIRCCSWFSSASS